MARECHVRFCERLRVKLLWSAYHSGTFPVTSGPAPVKNNVGLKVIYTIMTKITESSLMYAILQIDNMDQNDKEAICDEIFREQPNLHASVLP